MKTGLKKSKISGRKADHMAVKIILLLTVYLVAGFGLSYLFYPEWGKTEGLLRVYGSLLFIVCYSIYNIVSSDKKMKN